MSEIVPAAKRVSQTTAVANLARMCEVEPDEIVQTLKDVIMPGSSSAEFIAFAQVCSELRLNPLKKEIYAFKKGDRPFVPIVGVDGWLTILNRHPDFDGMEIAFSDNEQTGKPKSCTVTIRHKRRAHPVVITEYLDECRQDTPPWTKYPRRMLRNRTISQGARVAFGFVGAYDQDDVETTSLPSVPATQAARVAASGSSNAVNDRLKSLPEPVQAPPPPERYSDAAPEPGHATDGVIEAEATVIEEETQVPAPRFSWTDANAPDSPNRQETTGVLRKVERKPGRGSPYVALTFEDMAGDIRVLSKDISLIEPMQALVGRTFDVAFDQDDRGNRLVSVTMAG